MPCRIQKTINLVFLALLVLFLESNVFIPQKFQLKMAGTGCLDYTALVSKLKAAQYVAKFMIKTGLLDPFPAVKLIKGK
jgi:hypothetical protein